MRIFVTGATGFIGFAIVKELLGVGHEVTGLARSEDSGKPLIEAGARVQIGSVDDVDCLHRAAAASDGAVHTAFYHKLSHAPLATRLRIFLGGAPSGIVQRFMQAAADTDRLAVEAIGNALPKNGSPFAVAFGTMAMKEGQLATEDQTYYPASGGAPRAKTEEILRKFAERGIRTSAIRLPPSVHGADDHGFVHRLIETALKKKESAYVNDGSNRWPSVHRFDAARVFRLALEIGPAGGTYHSVAEEGIPFREIASLIGEQLAVPVVSKTRSEARKHFGFFSEWIQKDNPTSNRLTRERLKWVPTEPGLLSDLKQAGYFLKKS